MLSWGCLVPADSTAPRAEKIPDTASERAEKQSAHICGPTLAHGSPLGVRPARQHCWVPEGQGGGGDRGTLEEEGIIGEYLVLLSGLCLHHKKLTEGTDLHSCLETSYPS